MKTWMGIGFENDAAELHRHTKPTGTDADSKSYSKRAVQPKTGNSFRLQVPIFHDVFQCKNFLPPGISLTVTFTRMKDGFYLMCDDATSPKVKCIIEDLELSMKTCSTTPSHQDNHNARLLTPSPYYFPFVENNVTFLSIPKKTIVTIPQVVSDIMPFTLMAGFVQDSALACSSEVNPYAFQRHNLNKIGTLFCYSCMVSVTQISILFFFLSYRVDVERETHIN